LQRCLHEQTALEYEENLSESKKSQAPIRIHRSRIIFQPLISHKNLLDICSCSKDFSIHSNNKFWEKECRGGSLASTFTGRCTHHGNTLSQIVTDINSKMEFILYIHKLLKEKSFCYSKKKTAECSFLISPWIHFYKLTGNSGFHHFSLDL
jgi:hypothetical protein